MHEFPTIVTGGLAKQIAEGLREMILAGKIKADERLPTEEELAQQFAVSRPTIREALKRLAAENLVQSRRGPQGGTTVRRPSPEEVSASLANTLRLLAGFGEFEPAHIFEARCELESACCRVIAKARRKSHIAKMTAELAQQRLRTLTDVEFCASDVRFHRALGEATRNPILQCMVYAVSDALQPITNFIVFRFRDREDVCNQHQQLLTALAAGDAEAAVAVLQKQKRYLIRSHAEAKSWRRDHDRHRPAGRTAEIEAERPARAPRRRRDVGQGRR